MDIPFLIACAGIVFLASTVQGATAFGSALVAMPLLMLLMPAREAVVVSLVMGLAINFLMMAHERRRIQWRIIGLLAPASLAGTVAGAWLLSSFSGPGFKLLLSAVFLALALAYAPFTLIQCQTRRRSRAGCRSSQRAADGSNQHGRPSGGPLPGRTAACRRAARHAGRILPAGQPHRPAGAVLA